MKSDAVLMRLVKWQMPKQSVSLTRLMLGGVLLLGAATPGLAQSDPSIRPAAQAPVTPAPPKEWSGESGSSGHPDMQASAIRAAAANFESCVEGLWPLAAKRNISRASFDKFTGGLTPDLRIMDLIDAQPEFTKAFWDYLDILVSDARIANGRDILAKHKAVFDKVEKQYGVDRYIITAIWGVESNYGTLGGDRPVLRSTATLACVGRRQAYFRDEFLAALEILHRGDLKPEQLIGSWAGAFGPTQFMPTSFKRYAVDFDGDGRRDVVEQSRRSDRLDRQQSEEGRLGPERDLGLRGRRAEELQLSARRSFASSSRSPNGKAMASSAPAASRSRNPREKAYLLVPAGNQGPGFLMLHNFRVIMKYNPAEAYAMAIGHLADRLRGGDPFVQAWPRHEPVLTLGGAARNAGTAEPQGLRHRRAEWPAGRQGARRGARLPVLDRACPGRFCLGHNPGPLAGAVTKRGPAGGNQGEAIRLTISRG